MAITTTQQYVSEDPRFVAYKEGLLQDSSDFVRDQMGYNQVPILDADGNPVLDDQGRPRSEMVEKIDPATGLPTGPTYAPDQFVAGLSTPEQQAISLAQQGIGSYQPFLQRGLDAQETALQGLTGSSEMFDPSGGMNYANLQNMDNKYVSNFPQQPPPQGKVSYEQQLAGFTDTSPGVPPSEGTMLPPNFDSSLGLDQVISDPNFDAGLQVQPMYGQSPVDKFMNPYERQVIDTAMGDIQRAGDIQGQGLRAQAVGAGAFGGSRSGIMESELGRNVLDQQARTAGQMRQSGYQNALQQAQQAFEASKGRGLQGSQLASNIGQGIAGLGGMAQGALQSDIGSLTSAGALQRGVEQSGLDAMYKNQMQRYQMPYQQYGFLGDIYSGAPSTQQQITSQVSPDPSVGQQIAGLGIAGLSAAAGAQKAGLFG